MPGQRLPERPAREVGITYLQADAGLPQTGRMDAATQAAMQNVLTNGSNQKGSRLNGRAAGRR